MRKTFKKIAMLTIATVAIGVASLTSCTKDDEVINDVPAMEMKNGEIPRFLWTGCINLRWECKTYLTMEGYITHCFCTEAGDGGICAVMITPYGPGSSAAVTKLDVSGGLIQKIIISTSGMSTDVCELYDSLVENGEIIFHENCPIDDPEVLAVVETNYIPAGEYPITKDGEEYIITIAN